MTLRTCWAIASSLPTPFWTEQTLASSRAWTTEATAAPVCMLFVATIAKSQAGSSAGSAVARGRPTTSSAPDSRSPPALIASTWAGQTSYAHTSTSSSRARFAAKSEPTAPQPTTHTLIAGPEA